MARILISTFLMLMVCSSATANSIRRIEHFVEGTITKLERLSNGIKFHITGFVDPELSRSGTLMCEGACCVPAAPGFSVEDLSVTIITYKRSFTEMISDEAFENVYDRLSKAEKDRSTLRLVFWPSKVERSSDGKLSSLEIDRPIYAVRAITNDISGQKTAK